MNKVKLKNISRQISSGLTPSRSNPDFWTHGTFFWLKTEQLGEKYIYETNEKITAKAISETSIKIYPKGTLAIAMYGEGRTRGNISIIQHEMTTNQACCNIILDSEKADYEFVYYYLKTQYANLRSLSSGVRKNLNSNDIKEFEITLPNSINEQQRIAAVLSVLDEKLALNNKINAELEQMAKTVYDYWFLQFDFPDDNGKPYKSSGGKTVYNEILKRTIPDGWGYEFINDLGTITGGGTPSKAFEENFSDKGIPWITPKDLSLNIGNKFISKGELDVSEFGFKAASLNLLPANSVLMSSRAPVGYLAINRLNCTTNQGFKSIVCNKKYSHEYVYYTLRKYMPTIEANASGSTFKEISAGVLKRIKILKPKPEVVEKFVDRVRPIFEKQDNLQRQNQELATLRDWLLPMLMNGQAKVTGYATLDKSNIPVESISRPVDESKKYFNLSANKKPFAKQVLAGKIASTFSDDPNFTDIKFQKIQFLAEHVIEADLNLNYYYQAAGPYDNKFMHTIYDNFRKHKWFNRTSKKFIPLEKQGKIEGYYQGYFSPVKSHLDKLFQLLYPATESEAEIIATLYAVWNNRILEKKSITDEELLKDFYQWSERKHKYSEEQVLLELNWIRTHHLEPKGFGKLIKKANRKK